MSKQIEQGKFWRVQYMDTNTPDIIELVKPVKPGNMYLTSNGRRFLVLSQAKFKYTYEDIDNIRVLMEDYDIGTVQDNLRKRMVKAFKAKTPAVRFSDEEKEILSYTYYENPYLSDKDKATLRKVLGIKGKK